MRIPRWTGGSRIACGEVPTRAARAINSPHTLEQTLDAIVGATLASVPGFDHAGISIINRDGSIETKAATDQVVGARQPPVLHRRRSVRDFDG